MAGVCFRGKLVTAEGPDGIPVTSEYLVRDTNTDLATCAYVVETGSSQPTAWQELGNMSLENASLIGTQVALVWCIAWTFRALASFFASSSERDHDV